jgi:hypothetical protein
MLVLSTDGKLRQIMTLEQGKPLAETIGEVEITLENTLVAMIAFFIFRQLDR